MEMLELVVNSFEDQKWQQFLFPPTESYSLQQQLHANTYLETCALNEHEILILHGNYSGRNEFPVIFQDVQVNRYDQMEYEDYVGPGSYVSILDTAANTWTEVMLGRMDDIVIDRMQ